MGLSFCNLTNQTLDSYLKSDGRPAQIWANAGVSLSLNSHLSYNNHVAGGGVL